MDCEQEIAERIRELLPTDDDKVMFLGTLLPLLTAQTMYLYQYILAGVTVPKSMEEIVAISSANIAAFKYGKKEWIQTVPSMDMNEHEDTHWTLLLKRTL